MQEIEKLKQEKINRSLAEIESLPGKLAEEEAKSDADFKVLKEISFSLISCIPIPVNEFDGLSVLRGRPNYGGEVFRNVRELSFNPHKEKIELGRFNLKGESVFYGALLISDINASGLATAFCEVNKNLFEGQRVLSFSYITISKWVTIKPLRLIMLTFSKNAVRKSSYLNAACRHYDSLMDSLYDNDDKRKCQLVWNFFSERAGKWVDKASSYLLTTAFFHALREFYGDEVGLLYPSAMTENYGINVALPRQVIDLVYIKPEVAVMYKCQANPGDSKSFMVTPCSNSSFFSESGDIAFAHIW